jgi:hypothetical protein
MTDPTSPPLPASIAKETTTRARRQWPEDDAVASLTDSPLPLSA